MIFSHVLFRSSIHDPGAVDRLLPSFPGDKTMIKTNERTLISTGNSNMCAQHYVASAFHERLRILRLFTLDVRNGRVNTVKE